MHIFDSDGAPLSYQHLGRLAPEPPPEYEVTGRFYAEFAVTGFTTTATTEHELIADLVDAYLKQDADTLDFDMETP